MQQPLASLAGDDRISASGKATAGSSTSFAAQNATNFAEDDSAFFRIWLLII
jgi:hypothetical protein